MALLWRVSAAEPLQLMHELSRLAQLRVELPDLAPYGFCQAG